MDFRPVLFFLWLSSTAKKMFISGNVLFWPQIKYCSVFYRPFRTKHSFSKFITIFLLQNWQLEIQLYHYFLVACLSDESMEAHIGNCNCKHCNADSKMKVPESVRNFLSKKKQKKKSKTKRESKKDMSELDDSDDYDIVIESITFI